MALNSNPALIGSNTMLAAPSFSDLYLPVFGGEVLKRYNEYLTASKFIRRKTITSGNTAKFPRMAGLGAERHARGSKLLGLDTDQTQLSIMLDERPLVSHFRLDDIDQAMLYFDTRSELSMQAGQALAEAQDSFILRLLINASRATKASMYGGSASVFPGGGFDLEGAAFTSTAFPALFDGDWDNDAVGAFLAGLNSITIKFDQRRVPFQQRHVIVGIKLWHALRMFGVPLSNADLSGIHVPPLFGASGQFGWYGQQPNQGILVNQMPDFNSPLIFNGWMIWRSNLVPFGQNITTDELKYQGDFTNTRAIAFQMEAAAMVTLLNITTEQERDVSRQDWLFVVKMLTGGGTLRPECAVEMSYTP